MSKKFTLFIEDFNAPPQPWLLFAEVLGKELRAKTEGKLSIDSLFIFRQGKVLWAPDAKQFTDVGNYFTKRLQVEPELLKDIIAGHYLGFRKVRSFVSKCRKVKWQEISNRELASLYEEFCRIWIEIVNWGAIPQYLEMGEIKYSDAIKKQLKPHLVSFGDPSLVFSRLLMPLKSSYLHKENKAVWKLLASWQADPSLLSALQTSKRFQDLPTVQRQSLFSLSRRFGWLQYYYDGQSVGPEYYFDLLKNRSKEKASETLNDYKQEKIELKLWQKKAEKGLSLIDRKNIKLLREFALIKELRKEIQVYYLNYTMSFWFAELGRRLYCSQTQAKYLTPQEIRDFLYHKKSPNIESLASRFILSAYVVIDGKERVFAGAKAETWFKKIELPATSGLTSHTIEGQVAYPGRARGIVKIVNAISDLSKFNSGDILVSFSTNPSLVPAMNKAAAIITNTGGVTCHAAIVSREMKIPCVIGTKIATQVLHDGDLVEVDANKGLVKIIKS